MALQSHCFWTPRCQHAMWLLFCPSCTLVHVRNLALQGWHMDRLFTICYLPTCLLWLGIMIRFE